MNTLGILACSHPTKQSPPFAESAYFRQLSREGKKIGLEVIVFNPMHIHWPNRSVLSWFMDDIGAWNSAVKPLPRVVYDRCYYLNGKHFQLYRPSIQKVIDDPQIQLLGRALGGKYQTHQMLKKNPLLSSFLPLTIPYQEPDDLIDFCKQFPSALIKPNGGSHGIGVVQILSSLQGYLIRGRSKNNQSFAVFVRTATELKKWVSQFTQGMKFIIQPFLSLTTPQNHPFDLRILVQKNKNHTWETTGMAVRLGKANQITSNLHGGGQALKAKPFLEKFYTDTQVEGIGKQIDALVSTIPPHLEKHHGPLVELGLDIGIDRQGKVWLIEVNSKPGRSIFLGTGELQSRIRSIQMPIRYAQSLLTGQVGGSL